MINPFASYVYAGYIQKCFGMNGGLVLDLKFPLVNPDHIVVNLMGSMVPFKVAEFSANNNKPIIFLQDKDSITDVEFLKQCEIYVPKESLSEAERTFIELYGFIVEDMNLGYIGIVQSILESPKQKLLRVINNDQETLIPYHTDLIVSMDKDKKIIKMNLPQGFFD